MVFGKLIKGIFGSNKAPQMLRSEGPCGRYLLLAIYVEKGGQEQAARIAAELDIPLEHIDECSAEALVWAEEALGQSG